MNAAAPMLVLAGQSVRQLAQAAAAAGMPALALDAFGDRDTLAAARWRAWRGFDGVGLLDALHEAARAGAAGWIAGSGFEAHPDLLAAAAQRLPLLGTAPAGWRRVRDPRRFFPLLDALALPHPDTRWEAAPTDPSGWLIKDGAGCGGMRVRDAAEAGAVPPGPLAFWQRRVAGTPMSAAFVADGRRALLLGVHQQLVGAPHAPFAWAGAVGPLPVVQGLRETLDAALQRLVPACALRGLGSLDFMLQPGGAVALLEVNPRPGGTLQLYAPQSPLALHLRGCRGEALPAHPRPQPVAGLRVLVAPRALHVSADTLRRLARRAWVHDLPLTPTDVGVGEPVCSLGAAAPRADAVHALLRRRHDELIELLEDRIHELAC